MKVPKTLARACQVLRARVRFDNTDLKHERERTKLYVETWVVPLLDCIERGDLKGLEQRIGSTFQRHRMGEEHE